MLTGASITAQRAYAARWTRGARRGITILVNGQSNAVNGYEDGAWCLMALGAAWYLGALAWNIMGTIGSTMIGGEGLYQATGDPFPGSFLNCPNDSSAPSTWSVGLDGTAAEA